MPEDLLNAAELAELAKLDTPTVCNALEVVAPKRRGFGYTTEPLVCARPELPSIVGYARTATLRASQAPEAPAAEVRARRMEYYAYVDRGPKPSIIVIQDLDATPGYGSFWGEVNTNIHKGLGALGVITNGSIRDLPTNATGFQLLAGRVGPSHAWVNIIDYDLTVTIQGMTVASGDLIHADLHGAVVIPHAIARQVAAAAAAIARREAVLIGAAQRPGFNYEILAQAIRDADEIH